MVLDGAPCSTELQYSNLKESGCLQASMLGPASVDGVCGGSHVRVNCMIALRLTRGYRKSGDDREWRRELASNLPPASRHPRRILTSKMTPFSAVWLCPWRALQSHGPFIGIHWMRRYFFHVQGKRSCCMLMHSAICNYCRHSISNIDKVDRTGNKLCL